MKQSKKELIKECHSNASDDLKKRIEKEYPKLFREELVVGKHYFMYYDTDTELSDKVSLFKYKETIDDRIYFDYSFDINSSDENSMSFDDWFHSDHIAVPATEEEVEEVFIEVAKELGFKNGVNYLPTGESTVKKLVDFNNLTFYTQLSYLTDSHGGSIFSNNRWAKIIEGTITREEAENQLGKMIID